jgi:L-ascorbate metabolism protein UlaG (beta-lactamase superfamily)
MISPNTTIYTEKNISDRTIALLRPFISKVGQGIRSGIPIDKAVDVAVSQNTEAGEYFIIDRESFGLKSELLFAKNDRIDRFVFINQSTGKKVLMNQLSDDEVRELADIIFLLNRTIRKEEAFQKIPYPNLLKVLFDAEILVEDSFQTDWNLQPQEIGIVRLQHASFLLKTSKARIIVDPHFVSGYSSHLQYASHMLPQDFCTLVDAVLITHSHADHYHLPSLMMFPRDMMIIVPQSIESILSPDFSGELRSLGFKNVIELDWYSDPVCIGDIEISALPFYGEQPLRYQYPRDKNLRNWGNSYFFRTPFFNAFCLIDSGSDADGSMLQVAEFVKQQFGRVDVILSNLHEFYVGVGCGDPFYVTGNGHYWLSLTTDQIAELPKMSGDLLTLGVEGVSEICRITCAKSFLPYSHLWSEIGTNPPNELTLLEELATKTGVRDSQTKINSWRIGDSWRP